MRNFFFFFFVSKGDAELRGEIVRSDQMGSRTMLFPVLCFLLLSILTFVLGCLLNHFFCAGC